MLEFTGVFQQQDVAAGGGDLTEYSIWGTGAVGEYLTNNGGVVVGVKFKTSESGVVRGVRWYNYSGRTPTLSVALWQGTTNLSGIKTVSGETATGWQRQDFDSPVSIAASTIYIVSALIGTEVSNSGGTYAYGMFSSAVVNAPVTGVASSESSNGVYKGSATHVVPTFSIGGGDCFVVDVVFAA